VNAHIHDLRNTFVHKRETNIISILQILKNLLVFFLSLALPDCGKHLEQNSILHKTSFIIFISSVVRIIDNSGLDIRKGKAL